MTEIRETWGVLGPVAAGLFGLVIGSFINVLVHRLPRGESVVSPPSHCPACGAAIRAADNIPLFSWLLLKGRCRVCGAFYQSHCVCIEVSRLVRNRFDETNAA